MKKTLLNLLKSASLVLCVVSSSTVFSQANKGENLICPLTYKVKSSSVQIFFEKNFPISRVDVYRRIYNSGNAFDYKAFVRLNSYTIEDTSVIFPNLYEYKIVALSNGRITTAYHVVGEKDMPNNKKNVLILVDSNFNHALYKSLMIYKRDLQKEGRLSFVSKIAPNASVVSVKDTIKKYYKGNKIGFVFIVGHIPVPYSGNAAPDGHNNHRGAWASDIYYADLNGVFTDNVNFGISSSDPSLVNIPNDGKFDQNTIPSEPEVAVGRLDFNNLDLKTSEIEAYKDYFERNHKYRNGELLTQKKALLDDRLSNLNEGFSYSFYQGLNALNLLDMQSIDSGTFINKIQQKNYLFTCLNGFANDTSINNYLNRTQLLNANFSAVFGSFMGSYFGNFNKPNNFLRTALAAGYLAVFWGGRPHWYLQDLAAGGTIGDCYKRTVNNRTDYFPAGSFSKGRHIALLGDPTLGMNYNQSQKSFERKDKGNEQRFWWNISGLSVDAKLIVADTNLKVIETTSFNSTDTITRKDTSKYLYFSQIQETFSYPFATMSGFSQLKEDSITALSLPLPVTLSQFSGYMDDQSYAYLLWTVEMELVFSHYEIQKFANNEWKAIGQVYSNYNNANFRQEYSFTDSEKLMEIGYYRLKMIDLDGSFEYSKIIAIAPNPNIEILIFPNPMTDKFRVIGPKNIVENLNFHIQDTHGKVVMQSSMNQDGEINVDFLSSGVYFLIVDNYAIRPLKIIIE